MANLPAGPKRPSLPKARLRTWTGATSKAERSVLSERADVPSKPRAGAGRLRSEIIGLLSRFRNALHDELAYDAENAKALPVDLDEQVFGYFDELEQMRAAAVARADKKKEESASEEAKAQTEPVGAAESKVG